MNKHLNLQKLEKIINNSAKTTEEKEELWKVVEEIVHHKILGCILDNLDKKHHEEFLNKFSTTPFNENLIEYLEEKSDNKITNKIKIAIEQIESEILNEIK